ncbi:hypothetical protein [Nitrosopumilus sp.]|uniref:hypothetical protein n=1 Tax=Nitrosopumilus sp. TaxID=2024843 RepID=UPI003D10E576
MSDLDDKYDKMAKEISKLLFSYLSDKYSFVYTGTIDPKFYEGHKEFGETAGLKITIFEKGNNETPTYEQVHEYLKKIAELYGNNISLINRIKKFFRK